jgi:hypothetical protein
MFLCVSLGDASRLVVFASSILAEDKPEIGNFNDDWTFTISNHTTPQISQS